MTYSIKQLFKEAEDYTKDEFFPWEYKDGGEEKQITINNFISWLKEKNRIKKYEGKSK